MFVVDQKFEVREVIIFCTVYNPQNLGGISQNLKFEKKRECVVENQHLNVSDLCMLFSHSLSCVVVDQKISRGDFFSYSIQSSKILESRKI